MRLTELEPQWLTYGGRRVGFVFRSPTNSEWWQTCFVECFKAMKSDAQHAHDTGEWRFARDSQAGIVEASAPAAVPKYQLCDPTCAWTVDGGIEAATFETISVSPSLDGSRGGLWHGFIKNGEIV